MTQQEQIYAELEIFRSFASAVALLIKESSIKKLDPPSPDIECEFTTGKTVTFEMVEFLEQDFQRTVSFSLDISKKLYELSDALIEPNKLSTEYI